MPKGSNLPVTGLSLILLMGMCSSPGNREYQNMSFKSSILHRQYVSKGKATYEQLCANCHQADGTGLAKLYPPLLNSDFMIADTNRTIHIIKNGLKGEIMVNGVRFNQEMPANPGLTNLEISEVVAYIYKRFADTVVLMPPNEVEAVLNLP